ncbi:hypothetical protein CW304_21660 [Bacillus sp. UFRGS-B20]|nr:hypothetical protein CW304_21660 [Bacillus sp. UFRGS-B20]
MDETVASRVNQWLHTAVTEVNCNIFSCKTGKEAWMAGEYCFFSGIAMHDGWKPYDYVQIVERI